MATTPGTTQALILLAREIEKLHEEHEDLCRQVNDLHRESLQHQTVCVGTTNREG